jgi:hypothetical protein
MIPIKITKDEKVKGKEGERIKRKKQRRNK